VADKITIEDEKRLITIKDNLDAITKKQVHNPNLEQLKKQMVSSMKSSIVPSVLSIREIKKTKDELLEVLDDEDIKTYFDDPIFLRVKQLMSEYERLFYLQEQVNQSATAFITEMIEETNVIYQVQSPRKPLPEDSGIPTMTETQINELRTKTLHIINSYKKSNHSAIKRSLMIRLNSWADTKERFDMIETIVQEQTGNRLLSELRKDLRDKDEAFKKKKEEEKEKAEEFSLAPEKVSEEAEHQKKYPEETFENEDEGETNDRKE